MTNTELALNLLAEVSATELSRMQRPKGYDETEEVTISGGEIAGNARKELEAKLGRFVIIFLIAGGILQKHLWGKAAYRISLRGESEIVLKKEDMVSVMEEEDFSEMIGEKSARRIGFSVM